MNKEISYESLRKEPCAYEESEVPYHNPPLINAYEAKKPESKGYDQSRMRK